MHAVRSCAVQRAEPVVLGLTAASVPPVAAEGQPLPKGRISTTIFTPAKVAPRNRCCAHRRRHVSSLPPRSAKGFASLGESMSSGSAEDGPRGARS